MVDLVSDLSAQYQHFLALPRVSKAFFISKGVQIHYVQPVLTRETNCKQVRSFYVNTDSTSYTNIGFPIPLSENIKYIQPSPSRKFIALVRVEEERKDIIEIWNDYQIVSIIHCNKCGANEKSESISTGHFFSGLQWTNDEKHITFTTTRDPKLETAAFYEKGNPAKKQEKIGKQFSFEETWGDQLPFGYTSLWIAKVFPDTHIHVRKISCIPEDLNVAQPIWKGDASGIFFVGLKAYKRRLGHIYCTNRSAALYRVDLDVEKLFTQEEDCSSYEIVSKNCPEDFSVRYPSLSPCGKYVAYFTSGSTHTHSSAARIRVLDVQDNSIRTVIDIPTNVNPNSDDFPGIYNRASSQTALWLNSNTLIVPSFFHSSNVLYQVSVDSGNIEIMFDSKLGSYDILDVFEENLLVSFSSPTLPPQYFSVCANELEKRIPIPQYVPEKTRKMIHEQSWTTFFTSSSIDGEEFESILISPKGEGTFPLLAYPHGGPHSLSLGYHVLTTNYRGSLGFGQDAVDSLIGKCGTQDIQDVIDAIDQTCKQKNVDENKLAIAGGSHGGFIAAHCIGKYPNRFKAAVLRNPVINLVSNLAASDIPDWAELVAVGKTSEGFAGEDGVWQGIGTKEAGAWIDAEKLNTLFQASPIANVSKVITPTIICLGLRDQRVPNINGTEFYYNLKSRDVPCEIYGYNDPHAITQVHFAYDAWINISLFLQKHVKA